MLPIKKIYIDTRFKTPDSRSDSDFHIDLPNTLLMPEDTGFYIDDVCIPHTWYTVNENINDQLSFLLGPDGVRTVTIPEGIYSIKKLAAAIVSEMNTIIQQTVFDSEVDLRRNVFKIKLLPAHTNTTTFEILTDDQLKDRNLSASRSTNALINNFVSKGKTTATSSLVTSTSSPLGTSTCLALAWATSTP